GSASYARATAWGRGARSGAVSTRPPCVSPARSPFPTPGRLPSTSYSSVLPPVRRERRIENTDTIRMSRSRLTRSHACSMARKWRGLPWKLDTITSRNPWAASERPRSRSTAIVVDGRKKSEPACGSVSVAAYRNGSWRKVRPRWRSGRKRSIRTASPCPSSRSAPSGRCGPCTSSGEQVTRTTARVRSMRSNFVLLRLSQRRRTGSAASAIAPALDHLNLHPPCREGRAHVAGEERRRRFVAAQRRVQVREPEAAHEVVRPGPGAELADRLDPLHRVGKERVERHAAEHLVHLFDVVAEVEVIGVLQDDHPL